jgi:formiminoglutamate deiminase
VTLRRWHAALAWLPGGVERDVLIEASGDRFTAVTPGVPCPPDAVALPGLTLPGLANAHSHAFHRALRGVAGGGDFWSWRTHMYSLASRLDPDSYYRLARAVFAEMVLAGITCVGEFHYLNDASHEFGHRLLDAARDAGLRITLLDTCYLTADPSGAPLTGTQLRFTDGSVDAWVARVSSYGAFPSFARLGAAIHSVRAVPFDAMRVVADWAADAAAPLHAHLSEQPAENEACLAAYGRTPAAVFSDAGALGPRSTMVHATHLTPSDIALLGSSGTTCCVCPSTEADLGDGIGPAAGLAAAGSPLSLGSDSHAMIDILTEARLLEWFQRLATGRRGVFSPHALALAATSAGHACLGWPDAGQLTPGSHADLVTVSLTTPRTQPPPTPLLPPFPRISTTPFTPFTSTDPSAPLAPSASTDPAASSASTDPAASAPDAAPHEALARTILGATAADIRHVVIDGRDIVRDGRHLLLGDLPGADQ